ncbi:peptidoglycan-binding protein [Microbacterium protaetiae]|uniref:Peptidoglycan-binding protein n=1 Tax=Microbacterium protaetiae TaxID=2509458 RepID=A0A4P6ELE7_9MICO|nr:peptidoglycan-binding domain-containing protein [Microbacterium protaetiae]QAY58638.1 peptidoglycan-binding protein [Microbacterium protaetiae]
MSVGALVLTGGVLLGALVLPPLVPPSVRAVDVPRTVPVTARSFTDAHTIYAVPTLSDKVTVGLTGGNGMVTASQCKPGTEIRTGDHILSVDGIGRIALVTGVPLWRDLSSGSTGADVKGLQKALIKAGYELGVTRNYDADTIAAVEAMQRRASVAADGRITLDRVQWIPSGMAPVTSCEAPVGTEITHGQPLLVAGETLTGLTFPDIATDLAHHRYVAVSGAAVVHIPEGRKVTDATFLSAVASSDAFAQWKKDPTRGIALGVKLEEPISAIGVPPSAVLVTGSTRGCVISAHKAVPVQILASELGTVFVVPQQSVEAVIIPAANASTSCE